MRAAHEGQAESSCAACDVWEGDQMTAESEASFVRGCIATHPTVGLSDLIYLQHVLDSIGVEDA